MELKVYSRILMQKWWLMLPAFLITVVATLLLTLTQTPVYEAEATFVVRPHAPMLLDDELLSALETVSRRVEIGATYAEVADSERVRNRAFDSLALTRAERRGLSVNSQVRAGTNILAINVQGPNPEITRDVANAVGAETVKYVTALYDVFELESLDRATTPGSPIRPNLMLNLMLGGGLGLVLAVGVAVFAHYLEEPLQNAFSFNIMDPVTGVYNKDYLMLQLRQEMSRSQRHERPFSLSLLQLRFERTGDVSSLRMLHEALRRVATLVEPHLRTEDILARLNDDTFVILLPEMEGEEARRTVRRMVEIINGGPLLLSSFGDYAMNVRVVSSVTPFGPHVETPLEVLAGAERGLEAARSIEYGGVLLYASVANGGRHEDEPALGNGHAASSTEPPDSYS